jgi:hypothetical protein
MVDRIWYSRIGTFMFHSTRTGWQALQQISSPAHSNDKLCRGLIASCCCCLMQLLPLNLGNKGSINHHLSQGLRVPPPHSMSLFFLHHLRINRLHPAPLIYLLSNPSLFGQSFALEGSEQNRISKKKKNNFIWFHIISIILWFLSEDSCTQWPNCLTKVDKSGGGEKGRTRNLPKLILLEAILVLIHTRWMTLGCEGVWDVCEGTLATDPLLDGLYDERCSIVRLEKDRDAANMTMAQLVDEIGWAAALHLGTANLGWVLFVWVYCLCIAAQSLASTHSMPVASLPT